MSLIKLLNITKRYDKITALDHINLSIEDGEYVCILGQTGAGKTTLLRIIAGLVNPDEGEIYIEGKLVITEEENQTIIMPNEIPIAPPNWIPPNK